MIIPDQQIYISDQEILNSMKPIVSGIATVFGPNCVVSLHAVQEYSFPCIAVENGMIDNMEVGSDVSDFIADILKDEAHHGGKDRVGVFYTKTRDGHALKSIINIIRNKAGDLIGCLCINIDISVPLHEFIQNFIPVVDNDLAESLSDRTENEPIGDVEELIYSMLERAITNANGYRAISATEKNKRIVKELQQRGIFNVRSAVGIVAKQLGVSRYTIYNYLKDASITLPEDDSN